MNRGKNGWYIKTTPREVARSRGLKTYFTGEPCKRGHVTWRYVISMACTECSREYGRKWTAENPERMRELQRNWRLRNRPAGAGWQRRRRKLDYVRALLRNAKDRAKARGVPFSLKVTDITIPEVCPIFGTPLSIHDDNRWTSPSIDRIVPAKGYVRENIIVVSMRANWLKGDGTIEELERIVEFYKELIESRA